MIEDNLYGCPQFIFIYNHNLLSTIMKKLISILLIIALVSSCGIFKRGSKKNKAEDNYYMRTLIERMFTYEQFDSLATADNLSIFGADWTNTYFIDGETDKPINQLFKYVQKGDTIFVYSVIPVGSDSLFVNKRMQIGE